MSMGIVYSLRKVAAQLRCEPAAPGIALRVDAANSVGHIRVGNKWVQA